MVISDILFQLQVCFIVIILLVLFYSLIPALKKVSSAFSEFHDFTESSLRFICLSCWKTPKYVMYEYFSALVILHDEQFDFYSILGSWDLIKCH